MRHSLKAAAAAVSVASFVVVGAALPQAGATPGAKKLGAVTRGTGNSGTADSAKAAPTPAQSAKALLGMSAPANVWDQRVKEVGVGLQARRIFLNSLTASMNLPTQACNDGLYPIISFKTGGYSWSQVAAGDADAALKAMAAKLAALPCDAFVAIHHEPNGDGTPADWSAMQVHALPILGADPGVQVGVIGNGWWWSSMKRGLSDAEIAQWIPPSVIKVSDVIAGDTYQSSTTGEGSAVKIKNMSAWAKRVGGVKALGIGEFNAPTATGIADTMNALAADPLFAWACLWNANESFATVLTGARLSAFKSALAAW
jgi:hypothetical protein